MNCAFIFVYHDMGIVALAFVKVKWYYPQMRYADELEELELLETGTFLDSLVGGVPRRAITEVWGNWSSGKTTALLQSVANFQKQNLKCVWAAAESFYPKYAKHLGVDTSKLGLITGKCAEDILDEIIEVFDKEKTDVIVIDSIAALTPKAEMEKSVGEVTMAGLSKILGRFSRKVVIGHIHGNKTAIVGINQSSVNFVTGQTEGKGGEQWRYHRSVSVRLQPNGESLKQGDKFIGKRIKATVVKDKCNGKEKSQVLVNLFFGEGFDRTEGLMEEALRKGVLTRRGNLFYFEGEKLGMVSKMRELMKTDFADKLKSLV